jgi:hypothetical protein
VKPALVIRNTQRNALRNKTQQLRNAYATLTARQTHTGNHAKTTHATKITLSILPDIVTLTGPGDGAMTLFSDGILKPPLAPPTGPAPVARRERRIAHPSSSADRY